MQPYNLSPAEVPATVCILGDVDFLNELLKEHLNDSQRCCVLDVPCDYKVAGTVLKLSPPDLLIISYHFGTNRGDKFARELKMIHPELRIIGYSIQYDERQVLRMLDAGARAFLNGTCSLQELDEALDTVLKGSLYYNDCIYPELMELYNANKHDAMAFWKHTFDHLTVLIVHMLLTDKSRQQMADEIGISLNAFNRILKNVYKENVCKSETDLIRMISAEGLMRL